MNWSVWRDQRNERQRKKAHHFTSTKTIITWNTLCSVYSSTTIANFYFEKQFVAVYCFGGKSVWCWCLFYVFLRCSQCTLRFELITTHCSKHTIWVLYAWNYVLQSSNGNKCENILSSC